MTNMKRRRLIQGMGAAGLGAMAAPSMQVAFGGGENSNITVFIFFRGGIDGLSLIAPMNGHPDRGHYEGLRSNNTALSSGSLLPLSDGWGFHPAAGPLRDLWNNDTLAVVQAVGLPWANRSHFEAERYVELGTPGNRFTPDGWLTRHLQSATNLPPTMNLPAVVTEPYITYSLLGEPTALTLRYPNNFDFDTGGSNHFEEQQEDALADIYGLGSTATDVAGSQAMEAQAIVEGIDFDAPPANGAVYPDSGFGDEMRIMATLIKQDAGVQVCQTDRGGWDTHNEQGNFASGQWFYDNVDDISQALMAFYTDLDVPAPGGGNWTDRVTVICYSEFGRRAYDNADEGTDHGWGNNMMLLGGGVNGGQFFGQWPGLGPSELFQGADVYATTDYRNVLSEVLIRRMGNNQLGDIFPDFYNYESMGVVNGPDLPPDYGPGNIILDDGFESTA